MLIIRFKEVTVMSCSMLIVLAPARTGIRRIVLEKKMLIQTYSVAKSLHQPFLGRKLS